jgi:hypothetical protein
VIVFVMPLNYVLHPILSSQLAGEGFLEDGLPEAGHSKATVSNPSTTLNRRSTSATMGDGLLNGGRDCSPSSPGLASSATLKRLNHSARG